MQSLKLKIKKRHENTEPNPLFLPSCPLPFSPCSQSSGKLYIADSFLLRGGFNGFLVYRSLSICNPLDCVPPCLPFSQSDGFFFSLFSLLGFFLSNVEENDLFCIVVMNIVFFLMRQLDCKLHTTIDWIKKSCAKVSLLFLQHTDPQHTHTHHQCL